MIRPTVQTENYTLYRGDCLDVLPTLAAGSVDAVITDPPYGINGGSGTESRARKKGAYTGIFDDTPEYIASVVVPAVSIALEIAKRGAITPGIKCLFKYPKPKDVGQFIMLNGSGLHYWGRILAQPILYYGNDPRLGITIQNASFVVNEPRTRVDNFPCPKPIESWKWLVEKASLENEVVIDPFMGSGTTGVACAKTGRKFIGIELDAEYFDIAHARIANAYGDHMPTPKEKASPQLSLLEAIAA